MMLGWRIRASNSLGALGINSLDPTRRVSFHEELFLSEKQTESQNTCRRIFKMDMQDIANSTVVLADVRRSSGRGTGTSMELMFAHTKNKIIILWADKDDYIHPFYESIYTEKYFSLEKCIDSITYYY
jgi:nucleoside 2-deoxyribosyltransferase